MSAAGAPAAGRRPLARALGVRAALAAAAALLAGTTAPARAQGVALAGGDSAVVQVPSAAVVEPYANAGYRLRVDGGVARIDVALTPLLSRVPFALPPAREGGRRRPDAIAALARAVAAGATTRYEAVSRLLGWVGRNVTYRLDRSAPQDAAATLARREGYCTGVARLTVALLAAVGIPAREVPGYVAAAGGGVPAGYHRWVEVYYDDAGWVFSDPLVAHHYVPATYVRLASESLLPAGSRDGLLLARSDRRQAADLFAEAPPGVTLRRNAARQRAASLRVTVDGDVAGRALLEGGGRLLTQPFRDGASAFVGLEPGEYLLRVEVAGREAVLKRVILRDRVAASVHVPRPDIERPVAPPSPAMPARASLEALK